MKRLGTMLATLSTVAVAGCLGAAEYDKRLEGTLELMKYQQTLDNYLNPAEQASFKEKEVYVRSPVPLTHDSATTLQVPAGAFDLVESFSGAPTNSQGQASALPIRLHVFSRWKKPPKVPTKKGAPPPPVVQRGNFEQEVRSLLATTYGNPEVPGLKAETVNARGRSFKRLLFKSGADSSVRAYFYDSANHNVALVVDVPSTLADAKAAGRGVDYMLETLAVGNAARAAFDGRATAGGAAAASSGASF
jgi:hypothetical protein